MPPLITVRLCKVKCQKKKLTQKVNKKTLKQAINLHVNQLIGYPQGTCLGVRLHIPNENGSIQGEGGLYKNLKIPTLPPKSPMSVVTFHFLLKGRWVLDRC